MIIRSMNNRKLIRLVRSSKHLIINVTLKIINQSKTGKKHIKIEMNQNLAIASMRSGTDAFEGSFLAGLLKNKTK